MARDKDHGPASAGAKGDDKGDNKNPAANATAGQEGRYDPQNATGAEPPLGEGRHSGEAAAGTLPGGFPPTAPTAGNAGNRSAEPDAPTHRTGFRPDSQRAGNVLVMGQSFSDDVTVGSVSDQLRKVIELAKQRDFIGTGDAACDFFKTVLRCLKDQFRPVAPAGAMAEAQKYDAEMKNFDKLADEWKSASGGYLAYDVKSGEWDRIGSASGTPKPLGPGTAGITLDSGQWGLIIELVNRGVELARELVGVLRPRMTSRR